MTPHDDKGQRIKTNHLLLPPLCTLVFAAAALLFGCFLEETPELDGGYPPTLVGTFWQWDSSFGLRTLEFDTETHLFFHNDHRDGNPPFKDNDYYTYDPISGTGNITGEYPAGPFQIQDGGKTMYFLNFKSYGHGADFTRIERIEG